MKKNNKRILIISYSPLHRDPRIQRQIFALKNNYLIQTIGFTNPNVEGVDFFEIQLNNPTFNISEKIKKRLKIIFHCYKNLLNNIYSINLLCTYNYETPDCIFANDWDGLYAAIILKKIKKWNCKIYFDAHEYFPKYRENIRWKFYERPLINYVFKHSKKQIDIMSTVCPSLAKMYEAYFGFNKGFVRVITNSPDYEEILQPQIVQSKIRLIHHGGAMRARNLESMIDMMKFLPQDKYELHFMLVKTDNEYYKELIARSKKYRNIHFHEPVSFSKIPNFINQFDIGVFILNNDIITYKFALPNKFFEFVQARLAIAIGDSPEMRNYLEKYKLGVSAKSNNPEDLAEEILKLSSKQIMAYKENANKCAKDLSSIPNIIAINAIAKELVD